MIAALRMRDWPPKMQPQPLRDYIQVCELSPEHTPPPPEVVEAWKAIPRWLRVAIAAGGSWRDALWELRGWDR